MKNWKSLVAVAALCSSPVMGTQAASGSQIADQDAVRLSYQAVQARVADYGLVNARDEFVVRQVTRDGLGQVHVRLDQRYRGLPVFGEQLITHFSRSGKLLSITGTAQSMAEVASTPRLTSRDALRIAMGDFQQDVSVAPRVELMYVRVSDGNRPEDLEGLHLAYRVELVDIESSAPSAWTYFIDARTGLIVWDFDALETAQAEGLGRSLYSGDVAITTDSGLATFSMSDPSRGNASTNDMRNGTSGNGSVFTDDDNDWGNNRSTDRASAGVDAHYGASMTWDFLSELFGRKGIRDDGKGALSRVHYGTNYVNAFWSDDCFCMTYGDGDGVNASALVSIDVAAHEMTHGVTSVSAGLNYSGQSGGLNESMSDIIGTAVEFFAVEKGAQSVGEYWIGEDIWTPSKPNDALRYMDDPSKDGRSIDNASKYKRWMDVHYSSGVANNVFFLMSEGGVNATSRKPVVGIGRDKAQAIFYRALTTYMGPRTDFSEARKHTERAATDLYGAEIAAMVSVAWDACGVK